MSKKEYNTKTIGTIWLNTNKQTQEDFVSIQLIASDDKYNKGTLFFQDAESGGLFEIKQLKVFENNNHDAILGNICVELSDEKFSAPVTED